jgi:hypothetical protein
MKKILCALLALAMMLCTFAMAETIAPQFTELNTTDATYPAAFSRDDLKDGVLNNVHLYSEDIYDIVDVSKMAVGDTFEAEGKTITIETIDKDEFGNIKINGGFEEDDGYTLTTEEDTNGWITTGYDDFCTYTERGTVSFEMAENVTFTDGYFLDAAALEAGQKPLIITGIEAVTKAIMESENDSFNERNTELVIENGKVVDIARCYNP